MTKIYDELCPWPYHQPYGMVTAPKVKRPRKPRKSRAMPEWLKQQRKLERKSRTQSPRTTALLKWVSANPTVAAEFAETFTKAAKRNPKE